MFKIWAESAPGLFSILCPHAYAKIKNSKLHGSLYSWHSRRSPASTCSFPVVLGVHAKVHSSNRLCVNASYSFPVCFPLNFFPSLPPIAFWGQRGSKSQLKFRPCIIEGQDSLALIYSGLKEELKTWVQQYSWYLLSLSFLQGSVLCFMGRDWSSITVLRC